MTRHYSADHFDPTSLFTSLENRRIYNLPYCLRLDITGEERVRFGKEPRRIIGKKGNQWSTSVMLVFRSEKLPLVFKVEGVGARGV